MTDIIIPFAALEAGTDIIRDYRKAGATSDQIARAAFLAMIEAWPGMLADGDLAPGENGPPLHLVNVIILPLTEKTDDKA